MAEDIRPFLPTNPPLPDPPGPLPGSVPPPLPAEDIPFLLPAPRPPHPNFWFAVLWCLGILVVTQLVPGILGVIIFFVLAANKIKPEMVQNSSAMMRMPEYAQAMLPSLLLSQLLSVAMAWLAVRLIVGREWPRILAVRWPSWSHLVLTLLGLPGLMVVSMAVDAVARQVFPSLFNLDELMTMFGQWPLPLAVLIIGVGPGIGEELWFRGFFGRGIVSRHGVVIGILLTSLLFGVIHLEPRQACAAGVLGVFLHFSYLYSRSLLVPVLIHMANNSLAVLSMHVPALQAIDAPPEQIPWYIYAVGAILVAAVGWAFYRGRAELVDVPDSPAPPWRPPFPCVEYPPPDTATRVHKPTPGLAAWVIALSGFVLFVSVVVPAAGNIKKPQAQPRVSLQPSDTPR